jgi:GT2 family glycosyltransferase
VNAASAIVLNYNGRGFVLECVASLLAQDLEGLDVIVVDNGSGDGSAEEIEARFGARVRVLRAGANLGWGAGNNLGIRASRARHVILVNNDAVAAPGFARELVAAADARASIGMVAARVLDYARRDVIDTTGHLLHRDGLNRGRGRLEIDRGQYDGVTTALFPSGAAGLYRRAMLDQVGLCEETFFLYGDDAELGLRGRLAGWECAFAARAVAFHHYSRSSGAHSPLKAFYVERNRIWLALRLFPPGLLMASPWHTLVRMLHHAAAALSGRGAAGRLARERSAFTLVGVTLRAWAAALAGAPRVWRSRLRLDAVPGFDRSRLPGLLREFPLSAREAAFKE